MVTIMLIVVGALETIRKGLERELEELDIRGKIETVALLKSVWILRFLETWGDLLSL